MRRRINVLSEQHGIRPMRLSDTLGIEDGYKMFTRVSLPRFCAKHPSQRPLASAVVGMKVLLAQSQSISKVQRQLIRFFWA